MAGMDPGIAQRLISLNSGFYEHFGMDFSATRRRLQPGAMRVLKTLLGNEHILDLGCGNGELARTLARRGHRGSYLGLDFSVPLLQEARQQIKGLSAEFLAADLTSRDWGKTINSLNGNDSSLTPSRFSIILCLATLHHIPSRELRLQLVETARGFLEPNGQFILSNWQFLNSARLCARVQPWRQIGLDQKDVEDGDYLLDWRSGGKGLRYVHHFSEAELTGLAESTGFRVMESFYSDGVGGRLGLYQVWKKGGKP